MWIFGYGSLIWNPDFDYAQRVKCSITGFQRRFYQGSHDHRGTESFPGRVVTLVPKPEEKTVGIAYQLTGNALATMDALDFREKNGYQHLRVTCRSLAGDETSESATFEATTYIATTNNIAYLGPAPMTQMAACIVDAVGPSGPNVEYLFKLADALRRLEIDDPHVFELESHVKILLKKSHD